ncbi:MAG: hypothetical protein CM1200mP35_05210 [Chloroflexota bacterium]|nr:MAG: hypothetical protein CM1200mP35_05210 [Chloroflexota bacterium]
MGEAKDPYSVESIRSKEQSLIEPNTLRKAVQALAKGDEDHALEYQSWLRTRTG